ncbi:MAG: FMN-binding negative transcriptional regulator [Rhodospirillales bacterium]|nr:FMN-binding negative transcriptional regulator [Rhodospirillales bacterium]
MYLPRHFANADLGRLHDLIEERVFGLLVIFRDGAPDVAHIPFVLDRGEGSCGRLRGHFARANPIWRAFDGAAEALAVFAGPDTYVSPDWYVTPHQVPTWNYIAVHAAGRPRVMDDEAQVRRLLEDLSAHSEARLPGKKPWTVDKLPAEIYAGLTKGIVAFEMPIGRIEGKWKLNQNRAEADRRGVVAALEALIDPNARAIAAAMRKL